MQLSFHCLRQESLWQLSKVTKRHCEASLTPLLEQQPKIMWGQQGKRKINCGGESSPTLSHQISISLPGTCAAKYSH